MRIKLRKLRADLRFSEKKQSFIALIFLWAVGFLFSGYVFFTLETEKNKPLQSIDLFDIEKNEISLTRDQLSDTIKMGGDAYVFVNINKKHFLTRFVSTFPEVKTGADLGRAANKAEIAPVEKVTRFIKTKPVKKPSDFTIKPAPEI